MSSMPATLKTFGAPPDIVEALRHSGPDDIVWLGRAPTRIDLLRPSDRLTIATVSLAASTLAAFAEKRAPKFRAV
jgi:hypothetical protein